MNESLTRRLKSVSRKLHAFKQAIASVTGLGIKVTPKEIAYWIAERTNDYVNLREQRDLAERESAEMAAACGAALAMFDKGHCIDSFDWGKSVLTAENIRELNETPGKLRKAVDAYNARDGVKPCNGRK